MRELTFNITEDKRYLVEPTNVENFNLTFDKPNWVQGRVGEDSLRQVFVNVVTGPNNEPYDLTGINPEFDGLTPKGGEDNRNYVVIDNHHSVMIDAQGGRFRFDFPREAFAIAGSYKQAFFSLKREGTGEVVATLEFDMKVMANFVYETVKAVDYITPFDDVLDQLLEKYKQGNADREEQFNQFITNIQTQYNSIKSQFEASEALANALDERLKALETKIEQDDLFTKTEADELKESLQTLLTHHYDTVAEMVADTSLVAGKVVETNGEYEFADGGGAKYVIKSDPGEAYSVELSNGLHAVKIFEDVDMYYPEITSRIKYVNNLHTTIYTVTIPKTDSHGKQIDIYMDETSPRQGPSNYAREKHTSLTVNAGLSYQDDSGTWLDGHLIGNGQILNKDDNTRTQPANFKYLGLKADRSYVEYQNSVTPEEMLADGVVNGMRVYWRLIRSGQKVDTSSFTTDGTNHDYVSTPQPRIAIGFKPNGDAVIVGSDGRTPSDLGITSDQLADQLIAEGCVDAWNMDGGGSVSITHNEHKLNKNYDNNGFDERLSIVQTLNVRKPGVGGGLAQAFSEIGKAKQEAVNQTVMLRNNFYGQHLKPRGTYTATDQTSLDGFENFLLSEKAGVENLGRGSMMSGFLFLNATNTELNQLTGRNYAQTFRFEFTWDSNFGQIKINDISNPTRIEAVKLYDGTKPDGQQWSDWVLTSQINTITPTNVYNQTVNYFKVEQTGNVVVIDAELTIPGTNWINAVGGLPLPDSRDTTSGMAICNDGESLAQFSVQRNGVMSVRGVKGTFPQLLKIHHVYLTKTRNKVAHKTYSLSEATEWW